MKEINISKILVAKRKGKGVTQDELVEYIGVSKSSVSKWETGQSYPDITFLPQLAAYFNISIDELMGYIKSGVKIDKNSLQSEIELMDEINTLQGKLNNAGSSVKTYFKHQWNNSFASWQELKRAADFVLQVNKTVKTLSATLGLQFKETISCIISLAENQLIEGSQEYKNIRSYIAIFKRIQDLWNELKDGAEGLRDFLEYAEKGRRVSASVPA